MDEGICRDHGSAVMTRRADALPLACGFERRLWSGYVTAVRHGVARVEERMQPLSSVWPLICAIRDQPPVIVRERAAEHRRLAGCHCPVWRTLSAIILRCEFVRHHWRGARLGESNCGIAAIPDAPRQLSLGRKFWRKISRGGLQGRWEVVVGRRRHSWGCGGT